MGRPPFACIIRQAHTLYYNAFLTLYIIKGSLRARVTVRKCGVINKYTEISIAGNPINFNFKHLEEHTHQFTAAPVHNEAMAASIAGESR